MLETSRKKSRVAFSQDETDQLVEGVRWVPRLFANVLRPFYIDSISISKVCRHDIKSRKYGVGHWAQILAVGDFHPCRTSVSLKDRYRNIQHKLG